MHYLVSFYFLDLRFVITRPFGDEPRYDWLKPQWLWAKRNVPQVGRLGMGKPIPGRDRILPAFSQHATVDGGLMLQTQSEFDQRRVIERVEQDGFIILNREIVADEWGQVRFELLIEGTVSQTRTVSQQVDTLLALRMVVPLDEGSEIALGDAGELVARIYEAESLKTSIGFRNKNLRDEAVAGAAGTVFIAAEAPQVILIDLASELTDESEQISVCDVPCQGTLTVFTLEGAPSATLCWHLATGGELARSALIVAGWSAAFGLSWLVGHLYELAVFRSRVDEYERNGRHVLRDLVRTSIKNRNNRFGTERFGGWITRDVLVGAVRLLWVARGEAKQRLESIQAFAEDSRDAGGITGNIIRIINFAGQMTMNTTTNTFSGTFTGSNLVVSSTLTNVSQNIGGLPNADEATKKELTNLVAQLHAELEKLSIASPDRKDEIDAVAVSTGELIEKAKQDKPNRTVLQHAIDGVKSIAKTVADLAPAVLSTVTTIAGIVTKLHGL
jgi:hypothetical protein